jgi:hypothetical protein
MSDLMTLTEYKNFVGIPLSDTQYDAQLNALLAAGSLAIRNFTGRDFSTTTATEMRQFEYDGSGFLDIDDCTVVTSVALSFTLGPDQTLDSSYQWRAMPFEGPVYYYLKTAGVYPWGYSPEMGFTSNLDVWASEGRILAQYPIAKVTATWGWPAIPEDVKLALTWTMEEWGAGPAGASTPGVTSEAIEGFSRSWGGRSGQQAMLGMLGIPNRAKDILAEYQKIYV